MSQVVIWITTAKNGYSMTIRMKKRHTSLDSLMVRVVFTTPVDLRKKKHKGKGYRISNGLRLSMEITMTDRSVLIGCTLFWVLELQLRNLEKDLEKMVQNLQCNTNGVALLERVLRVCILWPYAHTKLEKIQQIIDHYTKGKHRVMNNKVVNLKEYKELMSLE